MKFLLIAALTVASMFAQTAEFVEAGAESGRNITGGIGLATTITPNTQFFGELTETTGAATSQAVAVLFGVKTNLPTIKKVTPFTIVGYGGSITSFSKLSTLPTTLSGLNLTSLTALGTAVGFAQQYAGGAEYHFASGFNLGIGMIVNKDSGEAWKGYPFLFLSKVF